MCCQTVRQTAIRIKEPTVQTQSSPQIQPTFTPIPPTLTSIPLRTGDANGDGKVDGYDYVVWLRHIGERGTTGNRIGDFNHDGITDKADRKILLDNINF